MQKFMSKRRSVTQGRETASVVVLSRQVQALTRTLSANKPEEKQILIGSAINSDFSGTIQSLSLIAQGDDFNSRTGDTINITRHVLRYYVLGGSDAIPHCLRVIVFRDTFQNGVLPTVSNVLESVAIGTSAAPISNHHFLYVLRQKRFVIISDKTYDISPNGKVVHHECLVFPNPYKIYYNATTGVTAAEGKNSTYILFLGDNAASGTNPDLIYQSQLIFTDS